MMIHSDQSLVFIAAQRYFVHGVVLTGVKG